MTAFLHVPAVSHSETLTLTYVAFPMSRHLKEGKMEEFKSIGNDISDGNDANKCHYTFRLDTYGRGCAHDCSYCYAKSMLDFRKLWNPAKPSVTDISKIAKEIRRINPKEVKAVRLGGMTDCFQPIEKLHRITYKTIRLLNKRRIPYLIVTKSAMVADDEYMAIYDNDLAHIQVTVTTLDDDLCATYEKASPPSERIKAILKLQEAGFDVQLRLSPFIPQYVDFDLDTLQMELDELTDIDMTQFGFDAEAIEEELDSFTSQVEMTQGTYQIIVDCDSENQMEDYYDQITRLGIECRTSTL